MKLEITTMKLEITIIIYPYYLKLNKIIIIFFKWKIFNRMF